MSFTPAQRQQAIGLYKRVLRTARETFNNDAATTAAWRDKVRVQWAAAAQETDATKIEEGLRTWEDVVSILRQNVVQGVYQPDREAYQLNFTPETELGSNESVKEGRAKQLEQLRANKGSLRCGGSGASSGSTSRAAQTNSPTGAARSFSSSARQHARAKPSTPSLADAAMAFTQQNPLPRPAPQFDQVTLLSDGSSIRLTTTSPRSTVRLTRDPTNHPLWNPSMERSQGASEDDESGRVARFRRRFGGVNEASASAGAGAGADRASAGQAGKGRTGAQPAPARDVTFGADDLDWMSVGGREARAGSAPPTKGKGKGKK